jgi:hypothetical protein
MDDEMWQAPDIVPSITYADLPRAVEWLQRVLDHEGNRWEISQRGRDLAAARWRLPPGVTRGAST